MWFVYLLVSLMLTALFYTGPILIYRFAIRKATLNKKQAIITTVVCGFVMYLLMWLIVHSITDSGANFTACSIWSFVNYYILTKEFTNTSTEKNFKSSEYKNIAQNNSNQTKTAYRIRFCRKCGNKIVENSNFCNACGSKIDWN